MARGEGRRVGERDERLDCRIGKRRAGTLGHVLDHYGEPFGDRGSCGGGERGGREPALDGVAAASGERKERPLDPPRRSNHEDRRERAPVNTVQPLERGAVPLGDDAEELVQAAHNRRER